MKDYIFVILLVIIIGMSLIQKLLKRLDSSSSSEKLPYHVKFILTNSEYKFYTALKPLIDDKGYIICPKVGLKDLIEVNAGTKDRQRYFGKIKQKHIDFLVCDKVLRPLFAIELDDKSHNRADVKEKDMFKDNLFKSAGFPLYRVPTSKTYSEAYIRGYIAMLNEEGNNNE